MGEDQAPYSVTLRRLRQLTIETMQKRGPATKITVKWEEKRSVHDEWEGWSRWSYRDPQESFWQALDKLVGPSLAVLKLPLDHAFNASVREIKCTFDGDDHQLATVKIQKLLREGGAVIELPEIADSGNYECTQDPEFRSTLIGAEAEAIRYALE